MKIGVLVERWISGGIENYLVTHFENMNTHGLEITIITSKKETSFFDDRLNNIGIDIIELLEKPLGPFLRPVYIEKQLKKFLKVNFMDVLHINANNGMSLKYAKIGSKSGVKRVIVHGHNSDTGGGFGRPVKLMAHNLSKLVYMNYPTDYWACSDKAAKWLYSKKINKYNYQFVKNGINTKLFKFNLEHRLRIRNELGIMDRKIIGTIGRLSEQKNQQFLIEIMNELSKISSDYILLIVGNGELEGALKENVKRLSLSDKVIFYGTSNNIPHLLSAMDIFVLPSKYEGFPFVGIEAQCSGLKSIVSQQVTKRLQITNLINYEHINKGNSNWVERIDNTIKNENRECYYKYVEEEGFDIKRTASELRKRYFGEVI